MFDRNPIRHGRAADPARPRMLERARRAAFLVLLSSLLAAAIAGGSLAFVVGRSVLVDDVDRRLDRALARATTTDEVPIEDLTTTGRVTFSEGVPRYAVTGNAVAAAALEAASTGEPVEVTRGATKVRAVPSTNDGQISVVVGVVSSHHRPAASLAVRLALSQMVLCLVLAGVAAWVARRSTRILESLFQQEDHLMRAVAHEVRNPLSRALVAVDEGLAGVVEPRLALQEAGAYLEGADELVGDLLEAARVLSGAAPPTREVVRLDEVASSAVESVGLDMSQVEFDLRPVVVVGSPRLLRRAVSNLVRNAVLHGYDGVPGRIVVKVDSQGVEVLDDGPGVEPERLERLHFESPVDAGEPGPGLGLTICGWAAELHGGRLTLANRESGGFSAGLALQGEDVSADLDDVGYGDEDESRARTASPGGVG